MHSLPQALQHLQGPLHLQASAAVAFGFGQQQQHLHLSPHLQAPDLSVWMSNYGISNKNVFQSALGII